MGRLRQQAMPCRRLRYGPAVVNRQQACEGAQQRAFATAITTH